MSKYTPMIEQYLEIKSQHQNDILFFRLGDFYEMFFADAQLASKELEIVLTARDGGQAKIPMCGIPYHSANNYIAKLIARGYRIAICEQVEDPSEAQGLVRREVIKIITPGTVIDEKMLDDSRNNYLAAVCEEQERYGLAFTDISTGEFMLSEFYGTDALIQLESEIQRITPSEILLAEWSELSLKWQETLLASYKISFNTLPDSTLSLDKARSMLMGQFAAQSLDSYGLRDYTSAIKAAAGIINFLDETQKSSLKQLKTLRTYNRHNYLELDYSTQRNLELTASLREGKKEGSLLGILDYCCTAMGRRALRNWIEQPLKNIDGINQRLDAVEELKDDLSLRSELKAKLSAIYDLPRLAGRIGSAAASPRDLLALKYSIEVLESLKSLLQNCRSDILIELASLDSLTDVFAVIEQSINDEAPLAIKEGNIIKKSYREEIDELRQLSQQGSEWLLDFENREKQRTGIKYLKVGFNKVFGYYIEISKSNIHMAPPDYHRKQTLVNTERFICQELKEYEEKILGAREKLFALEYEEFINIREQLCAYLERIQKTAGQIATLDVLYSLAEAAYQNDYVRPAIDNSGSIEIKSGRHPVVEKFLKESRFVPNDLKIDRDKAHFAIITGPNMGGKSTFMRQTALLVIMAQMGSYIPVQQARIGIIDRIFTRVGASDDLASGQSTFMVEMLEVANILNNASEHSLVILDEIGRGTSTYDGLSIAQAVSEYIHDRIKAKTLFATHYHELTSLSDSYTGVVNLSVSVKESGETVVFLKKVLPGKADKSYGIHVAQLAGLPEQVILRARDILENLEKKPESKPSPNLVQPLLFAEENPVVQELQKLDLDELSPREAHTLLYRWKEIVNNKK
ncbi:MAG: DNA mismatch repair protein MutS [Syntrophomonas sp.]